MTPHVLIVDDEPSIVISLEYLMRREGFRTSVASDGEAALAAVAADPPDLLILDVMLPTLSGFDVCQRLRADPRWRALPILMLTAKGRDTEVARGLELGADAYMTKPFSTRDLVEKARQLLAARP